MTLYLKHISILILVIGITLVLSVVIAELVTEDAHAYNGICKYDNMFGNYTKKYISYSTCTGSGGEFIMSETAFND